MSKILRQTSIFAYGQTGSGKTHTLEGPPDCFLSGETGSAAPAEAGLIPRAVQMLWSTADALKDKGWKYDFEGQMLEIVSVPCVLMSASAAANRAFPPPVPRWHQ